MSVLSRICGSLEARINQPRLSILRTIYFNFRTLPFKQAIKLPIFISVSYTHLTLPTKA